MCPPFYGFDLLVATQLRLGAEGNFSEKLKSLLTPQDSSLTLYFRTLYAMAFEKFFKYMNKPTAAFTEQSQAFLPQFRSYFSLDSISVLIPSSAVNRDLRTEWEMYQNDTTCPRALPHDEPSQRALLGWWEDQKNLQYPHLAPYALRALTAPASSAEPERIASAWKKTLSSSRQRFTVENLSFSVAFAFHGPHLFKQ